MGHGFTQAAASSLTSAGSDHGAGSTDALLFHLMPGIACEQGHSAAPPALTVMVTAQSHRDTGSLTTTATCRVSSDTPSWNFIFLGGKRGFFRDMQMLRDLAATVDVQKPWTDGQHWQNVPGTHVPAQ